MDIWRYVTTPFCVQYQGIEDLTRVVISKEIYVIHQSFETTVPTGPRIAGILRGLVAGI